MTLLVHASALATIILASLLFAQSASASLDGSGGVLARVTRAQCARVCGVRMTLECCDCIGCHQGMRFGKRSVLPAREDDGFVKLDTLRFLGGMPRLRLLRSYDESEEDE